MPWACGVRSKSTNQIVLIQEDEDYPEEEYEDDMHVVPFVWDGDTMLFGCHDFTRSCPCGPKPQTSEAGELVIVHRNKVN